MRATNLVISAVRSALSPLGYDIIARHRQNDLTYQDLYPRESLEKKLFYNIGSGGFSHTYWTNVDHISPWYSYKVRNNIDIDWDLLKVAPLPVEDDVAEAVYTSHTIEHVTDEAANNMFREAYRILKPGGFFRVTTPDVDLNYRAYREGDAHYFYWFDNKRHNDPRIYPSAQLSKPGKDLTLAQRFLWHLASSVSTAHADSDAERIDDDMLRLLFDEMEYHAALDFIKGRASLRTQKKYPGNHINWWNERKLKSAMEEAGFETVYRSGFGQSYCPAMRYTQLFDNTHPPISVYMEARK